MAGAPDRVGPDTKLLQHLRRHAAAFLHQPEQDLFAGYVAPVPCPGLLGRQRQGLPQTRRATGRAFTRRRQNRPGPYEPGNILAESLTGDSSLLQYLGYGSVFRFQQAEQHVLGANEIMMKARGLPARGFQGPPN